MSGSSDLSVRNVATVPLIDSVPLAASAGGGMPPRGASAKGTRAAGDDTLYLVVGGQAFTTWIDASVTRGIELMPSTASFLATERYPGAPSEADIKAGDPCQVMIGKTLLLTGYVDQRIGRIGGGQGNLVQILVRSKCEDLVDCAVDPAAVPNMLIDGGTPLSIATKLAGVYGIKVQQLGDGNNKPIAPLSINLGDSPWDVIERIAHYSALLPYDETDGSLNLAQLGVDSMASGFVEGVNVEAAQAVQAMDQRYSDIDVYFTSAYMLSDLGSIPPAATVRDTTVPRFRKHIVISPQAGLGADLARQVGLWEVGRRYGRSQPVVLTTDSWRDSAGALWQINKLVPLSLPHLKLVNTVWLITQVTFRRSAAGTRADLVLMPPTAFTPEPSLLFSFDAQFAQPSPAGQGAASSVPNATPDSPHDGGHTL